MTKTKSDKESKCKDRKKLRWWSDEDIQLYKDRRDKDRKGQKENDKQEYFRFFSHKPF